MKKLAISIAALAILSTIINGCATKSKNVQATYTSPLQYQHYNCDQVRQEYGRITRKVTEVAGKQDSTAGKDSAAMAVGMVLFWPALFFLAGGDHEPELARLKGEHEAVEIAAIEKQCTTVIADIEAARERQAKIEAEQKKIEEREEQARAENTAI